MSLSTAWRHRRCEAEEIAQQEISTFTEQVEQSGLPVVVQFDEKELEEDIGGKVGVNYCHPLLFLMSSVLDNQEKSTGCAAGLPLAEN